MKRILIIEDDQFLADMYRLKLQRAGYAVGQHGTAVEALDALDKDLVDAVLLDILLPDKNGLWFLKELRTRDIKLPIVILSNLAETDFAMPARLRTALNIEAYLVKTQVTPAEVVAAIQQAVG